MFSSALQQRERERQEIEAAVTGMPVDPDAVIFSGKLKKRGEHATTLTLSCSTEDKVRIKMYAARHSMSVSDLLHQWITEHCGE